MKRIFFVEDDLSLINGLSFAIKKQGYEIDIVRTVLEAHKIWQDGKYDLVILDVSLPDGNGYDLIPGRSPLLMTYVGKSAKHQKFRLYF